MIPELGHAALWLAAAFALGGALLPRLAGRAELAHAFAAPAVTAYAVFALTALAALGWAFAAHDFSVALVNDHGHTSRAPLATIAAAWSTPPGALLFWLASLGIAGTVLAAVAADTLERTRTLTMLLSVAAAGEGYTALELALAGDATLRPQSRTSFAPGGVGAPPALDRSARGDLHASFDGRSLTLAWRPFAWTIWAGAVIAALGGFAGVLARRRN